jgi:chromosomal replication initiator protein
MSISQQDLWERVRLSLKDSTNQRLFATWLEDASLDAIEETAVGKILKIGVPGPFYKDWIATNLMPDLEKAFSSQVEQPFKIELVVNSKNPGGNSPGQVSTIDDFEVSTGPKEITGVTPRRDFLNSEYTFGTFVVGQGNQFAHAACHSVSEKPGNDVNPLFICGPSGTGKTHLLNAVGNSVREKRPHMRICYISGERFINDVVTSIRHNQMDKFRSRYREKYDFLIIDDIHVLARTNSSQEEFFYTFNAFHEAGKQVVVASDKLPREMDGLEDRIRTRLEWGLTVDIQPPDVETRMAILRYKAEKTGVFIPDDVVSLIAQFSRKSVRELEGHLATIRMYSELRFVPITMDLAKEVFASVLTQEKTGLTVDELQRLVATHYNVTTRDLKSETRVKTIVKPRQVAMYLTRKMLDLGFAEIGRAFGNRDHTTVLHAEAKIKEALRDDPDFKSEVSRLETHINNSQWTRT